MTDKKWCFHCQDMTLCHITTITQAFAMTPEQFTEYERTPSPAPSVGKDEREYLVKIANQAARISQLETGLEPFSAFAGELFARNWNSNDVVFALDNPDNPHRIVAGDFFNARALLKDQP